MDSRKEGGHKCLECGDRIRYGREDKKFCSDECRNRFHYKRNKEAILARRRAERSIEKNYGILDGILKEGVSEIDVSEIVALGFRPEYVTYFKKNRRFIELACFDIRYRMSELRIFGIERMDTMRKCGKE